MAYLDQTMWNGGCEVWADGMAGGGYPQASTPKVSGAPNWATHQANTSGGVTAEMGMPQAAPQRDWYDTMWNQGSGVPNGATHQTTGSGLFGGSPPTPGPENYWYSNMSPEEQAKIQAGQQSSMWNQAAPQTQVPSAPASQPWYDIGGEMFPRFNVNDLSWMANAPSGGGLGDSQENFNSGAGNVILNNGGNYGHFSNLSGSGLTNNNYQIGGADKGDPFSGNTFDLNVKTGKMAGQNVQYTRQGNSWVPVPSSSQSTYWNNTNPGIMQYAPLLAAGAFAAAPAIAAGFGAAGGAGGMAAGEGAMLGGGIAPLTSGGASAAELAALGGEAIGGGGIGGTGGLSIPGAAGISAAQAPAVMDLVKKGMSVADAIKAVGGMVGGGNQQQPSGSNWQNALGGLGNLWSAYEGSRQMKDYASNLKQMHEDALARQKPYRDKLQASYDDPNSFYNSEQWKGLESVYQNQIDRKAATAGRLANPTDREVLLQQHAMKGLEDYRTGLSNTMKGLSPDNYIQALGEGYKAESMANNPWGGYLGQNSTNAPGGGGTNFNDLWKTIKAVGSTGQDIWKFIEGWF